jgi:glycosyltransferase involved in cell wall biosynthesis
MSALVSVIMPVRDGGAYLAEAVDSILEQSFDHLELLLVDDHSQDASIAGLDRADKRLRLLSNPGQGVAQAFNHGLNQASGDFICRMDADDVAMPHRLRLQMEFLAEHPHVDICGGCVEIFSSSALAGGNLRYQQWLNSCRSPEDIHQQLFIESPIPNPTAFFRREAIRRLGGYQDPVWPEDYDLFLRADALGMRMGKPKDIVLRWREHERRLTRTDGRYDIKRFQQAKAHFLVRNRLGGRAVVLWGAGPSGRLMHDLLTAESAEITGFLDVHPRRIGGEKRGLPVFPIDHMTRLDDECVLVAVGSAGARKKIQHWMDQHALKQGCDYLFVA